jgi:N-acetylneuraminate synthase/N,N'-diacetyllegionaminate synthase
MKCGPVFQRKKLRTLNKTLIIAEAGVNHNGDLARALDLIDAAANAGVDYVKFQTFKAKNLVAKSADKAAYQKENTGTEESQYEMLQKLEIPDNWYPKLLEKCKDRNIQFLSTGFDEESIDFLDDLGCDFYKIPSGELTNKPYLEHIAQKGKPMILSTGMATIDEISDAVKTVTSCGISKKDITILHCNTQYPTPMNHVNLLAMNDIEKQLDVQVGYSDHTLGIEVPIAAVALGASVIEKHFTMDRDLPGPDHRASLEPDELKAMVDGIRNIEQAISGTGKKEPSESEKPNIAIARKSIHINKDLSSGHKITKNDLIMIRPGDGISPMEIDSVLGKKLARDYSQYEKLALNDIS